MRIEQHPEYRSTLAAIAMVISAMALPPTAANLYHNEAVTDASEAIAQLLEPEAYDAA